MLSIEKGAARLQRDDVLAGFKKLLPISVFVVIFGVAFGLTFTLFKVEE